MINKQKVTVLVIFLLFVMGFSVKAAAPVASFTASALGGCAPFPITFNAAATMDATNLEWTFPSGTPASNSGPFATTKNPTVIFSTPGTYTITLKATGTSGPPSTTTRSITIWPKPSVAFSSSVTTGCATFCPMFTNSSTPGTPGGGALTSYLWSFGNLQNSTTNVPSGVPCYTTAGTYDVSLKVTDANGCVTTLVKPAFITVEPSITANFTTNPAFSCSAPATISFTNTSSPSTGLTYSWNFGNGVTNSAATPPSQTYTSTALNSSANICLTIRTASNCVKSTCKTITMLNPIAEFSAAQTSGCQPFLASFTDQSIGGANQFSWNFGDPGSGANNTSTLKNPTHLYTSPGTYTVTMNSTNTAVTPNNCTQTRTRTSYITVFPKPDATFSSSSTDTCGTPFPVTFFNTTPGVTNISWDYIYTNPFTSNATGSTGNFTYTTNGSFSVAMRVVNSFGCSDTIIKSNHINITPPTVDFSADTVKGCIPLGVNFTDLSSTTPWAPTKWVWSWGDGSPNTTYLAPHTGTFHHDYTVTGRFDVTLTITNSKGCTATITKNQYIRAGRPPVFDFVADKLVGCYNKTEVNFTYIELGIPPDTADKWDWDFGVPDANSLNEGTSTLENPSYTYTDTGYFDVRLIVEQNGCPDTLIKNDYIFIRYPKVVFFSPDPTICTFDNHNVAFTNTTHTDNKDNTSYFWNFGDPVNSTPITNPNTYSITTSNIPANPPTHYYGQPAIYTVKMRAVRNYTTTPFVCEDSTETVVFISNLKADFFRDSIGCEPFNIWDLDPMMDRTTDDIGQSGNALQVTINYPCAPSTVLSRGSVVTSFPAQTTPLFPATTTIPPCFSGYGLTPIQYIASNTYGCSDTITKFIVPKKLPHAYITNTSETVGCMPLLVSFASYNDGSLLAPIAGDTSFAYNGASIDSVYFDYLSNGLDVNDAFIDVNPNAVNALITNSGFVFNSVGTFVTTITVVDNFGCVDTDTVRISPKKPIPNFSHNAPVCSGTAVTFNPSATVPANTLLIYKWQFGDGSSRTDTPAGPLFTPITVDHTYYVNTTTTFTVRLTVIDQWGCSDFIEKQVTIVKPVANFTSDETNKKCYPDFIFFEANVLPGQVDWTFAFDGVKDVTITDPLIADSALHVFTLPGTYDVTLYVTDNMGCTDTLTKVNFINIGGPFISNASVTTPVSASPIAGSCPYTITCSINKATGTVINVDQVTWFLSQNGEKIENTTGDDVTFEIYKAGTWLVNLYYFDLDPLTGDTLCQKEADPITVSLSGPTVGFSISDSLFCGSGGTVNVTNNSSFTGANVLNWLWEYGDGATSSAQNPGPHLYNKPGKYMLTVKLGVVGCTNPFYAEREINVFEGPKFTATMNPLLPGCVPLETKFFLDYAKSNDKITNVTWDFGDGYSISGLGAFNGSRFNDEQTKGQGYDSLRHRYIKPGMSYFPSVALTFKDVFNKLTCTNNYNFGDSVRTYPEPLADFDRIVKIVDNKSNTIVFRDSSIGATSWRWEFGDGEISTEQNPKHVYNVENTYNIVQYITNQFGCPDTAYDTIVVNIDIVIPNIFTPNNDLVNDKFNIKVPGFLQCLALEVFDRWGRLVYKNENYHNDWDGKNMKGEILNDDTYYYVIKYCDELTWNGWVMIKKE